MEEEARVESRRFYTIKQDGNKTWYITCPLVCAPIAASRSFDH